MFQWVVGFGINGLLNDVGAIDDAPGRFRGWWWWWGRSGWQIGPTDSGVVAHSVF